MGSRRSFELSHVPNIGFKYGNEEYLAITGRSLVKGDLVAWSLPNGTNLLVENEEPLVGIVEFVGCKGTPTTENLPPELKAVVQFTQSTCHLPGHITTPPSNRNLIPASQLTRMGDGQWELDTRQSYSAPFMKMSIQLIGNCLVKQQNMEKLTMDEFPQGEPLILKTESHVIEGKVMTVGDIQISNRKVRCVGVKFGKSIEVCSPAIQIVHINTIPSDLCELCSGGTLAFIPMKLLTYSKKNTETTTRHVDDVRTNERATIPKTPLLGPRRRLERSVQSEKVEPVTAPQSTLSVVKGTSDPVSTPTTAATTSKRLTCSFVGNCVAMQKGITEITVDGIRKDDQISARNQRNLTTSGVVIVTCTIIGLETEYKSYVGVKFKKSFADLCESENAIVHCDQQVKQRNNCKRCAGGKLVFIPTDLFLGETECAGIIFDVHV